jgi:hypothetical protein
MMGRNWKKPFYPVLPPSLLVAGCILSCIHSAHAARTAYASESPQLIKARMTGGYFETEARYEQVERTSSKTDSLSYNNELLEIRPKIHLNFDGSIYHPYLFDYDLAVELGQSFEYERLAQENAADPDKSRSDSNPLQYYTGQAHILREKTLSGVIFGNHSQVRRDNGFFSRRLLEQTGYGAKLNYAGDALPWSLSAEHRDEEETDTRTPRDSMQDELTFKMSNERGPLGKTQFYYLYHDFERKDFNIAPYSGIRNSARLNDSSYLFNDILKLKSNLYYNDVDTSSNPSTSLTLREWLNADHAANLSSTHEYGYSSRESGSSDSTTHHGRTSLRHQLYESLTSTVSADFRNIDHTTVDISRHGFSVNESYRKRIGASSRLSLGAMFSHHTEDRNSTEDEVLNISNEPHTLTTGQTTTLNQPNASASSIVVTDSSGTILYSEFIDYRIIQRGTITEIQRVVGGSIPNGGAVLISYTAINQESGTFTTRQGYYRFRIALLEQLLAIYGHLRIVDHADEGLLILEELTESVIGIESSWKWFNIGMEYENYDSSLLPTKTLRFFQNANFNPSWRSALRLSLEQSKVTYTQTDEEVWRFFNTLAYQIQVTPKLSWKLDGSTYSERRENSVTTERDLLAANTDLDYRIGKTLFTVTYEYRIDDYLNETRRRQTAYLKVRRNF